MEEEREEGEIVDLNDDDIYENIISSDEVDEDDLRQRIEELEAKNSELEKIASISKTDYSYDLDCGSNYFINLADDNDDESYYRQPSKYDYSSYPSSRKRSRSKRRKACRHECKTSKRYKPYKTERRKKTQPNRTRISSVSSSDDEFQLDRKKLQAALKRNNTSNHSTTLKRKLIGVSRTVQNFIDAKEDVGEEDISTSFEIMELLHKINVEETAPSNKVLEGDKDAGLDEQELRLIALKSAILKKAEARKKRKIIETQPYSPTDDVVVESAIASKFGVNAKPKDDLDNMDISPAMSPVNEDGCLQPIDMELESDDENQKLSDYQQEMIISPIMPAETTDVSINELQNSITVPVPVVMSLINGNVPENHSRLDSSKQPKPQEEEDEEALRASLLANMKAAKRKPPSNDPQIVQHPIETEELPSQNAISDATSEMEHLRKQVLSSMGKRKQLLPNPFAQKFSVQVPRPIEMTMPQITSSLKEALKRINVRDKQNVLTDPKCDTGTVNLQSNIVAVAAKEIEAGDDFNKTMQAEINELKLIAHKLNGGIVSPKIIPKEPSNVAEKKTCESSNKTNEVLKNVTCNNSSVECKTVKDNSTAPLVSSNKIEAASLEKSDTAIRSLKAVAQKKVNVEPNLSLNQKENQQLRKVSSSAKRPSEEKIPVVKKTKVNNVKVSRAITTLVEKPVKKLIIQLNNSDTESDDLGVGQQNTELSLDCKSYSGVASPVSYCTFSPSSPANATDTIPAKSTNDSFQQKLDEYLKSARTKVEQTKLESKPIKRTPSLVSHLPPSSQLEYRKLISRMALLEKQKLLKLSKSKAVAVKPKPSNNISVTIENDLCNQQASDKQIVRVNCNDTTSRSENRSEMSTKTGEVAPELPVDSAKPSIISAETCVTDSGIESSNAKSTEATLSASHGPETSSNPKRISSMIPEHDGKNKLLLKCETEYMSHSELYLVDLNNMSLLVNKARLEKEKQFHIESEIEELEARVQLLKKQLVQQKASVSKLYPVISTSHKSIMQKRSKSMQLNKKCYLIGNKIVGADYTIPNDPKVEIAQRVKSLSSETKLLRNMKKPAVCKVNVSSASTEEKCSTDKQKSENASVSCISADEKHSIIEHTPVVAAAVVAGDDVNNVRSSINPDAAQSASIYNGTHVNIPMPYSQMKYDSPLDHMKNIGFTNPDSIVCPFQLLGQCEDRECTYQHLS